MIPQHGWSNFWWWCIWTFCFVVRSSTVLTMPTRPSAEPTTTFSPRSKFWNAAKKVNKEKSRSQHNFFLSTNQQFQIEVSLAFFCCVIYVWMRFLYRLNDNGGECNVRKRHWNKCHRNNRCVHEWRSRNNGECNGDNNWRCVHSNNTRKHHIPCRQVKWALQSFTYHCVPSSTARLWTKPHKILSVIFTVTFHLFHVSEGTPRLTSTAKTTTSGWCPFLPSCHHFLQGMGYWSAARSAAPDLSHGSWGLFLKTFLGCWKTVVSVKSCHDWAFPEHSVEFA